MNGKSGWRTALEIVIVVLQTVLVGLGWQIHAALQDHETRIYELEMFVNRGDRWTLTDQRQHEREVSDKITDLLIGQEKIKGKLGIE